MTPMLGIMASSASGSKSGSFDSIITTAGTGASATITFSSIPQTYKHLQIRGISRDAAALTILSNINVTYNGIATATYFVHKLFGDSSGAQSNGNSANSAITYAGVSAGGGMLANAHGVFILDIHDYASTTKTKTLRSFMGLNTNTGTTSDFVGITSGSSTATTAITSIAFNNPSNNFATTTSFALYGIK